MRFASLGSGSRGNGSIVASDSTTILIDCGFTYKDTLKRLERFGVEVDSLSGIVVTHEHSDHIGGVETLSARHNIPVYASYGTWIELGEISIKNAIVINGPFSIFDIKITPITVPHDARQPLQFVFTADSKRLGILSDLGTVSARVLQEFRELDAISIEFNHDWEMLHSGPYPLFLKERIGGDFGHLNNEQASRLLKEISGSRLRTVVACHISEKNNEIHRVEDAIDRALNGKNVERFLATQSTGFDWINLGIL